MDPGQAIGPLLRVQSGVIMRRGGWRVAWEGCEIIVDPTYGYMRVDPLPSPGELAAFYRDKYYRLVTAGGRAPELRRLQSGGEEARAELEWMARTWWRDIRDILGQLIHRYPRTLLDVGCGYGHFAQYMASNGWEVIGVEPSNEAREACSARAIPVFESVEELRRNHPHGFFAVTLLNVLEHVPDPAGLLSDLRPLMTIGESVLVCKVPNDFSPLQLAAQAKLARTPWWVVLPDHLNYFNFTSLAGFLHCLGFEVLDMVGTFPMEIFLLWGDNYLESQKVGELCHNKRRVFELSIPPELRRSLYRCFARAGIGRECIVFARAIRR